MAIIYEGNGKDLREDLGLSEGGDEAENRVCDWIRKCINSEIYGAEVIGKREFTVVSRSADVLLIIPRKGLLVIEIKAFSDQFIEDYDNEDLIHTADGKKHRHPYDQARDYVDAIRMDLARREYLAEYMDDWENFCSVTRIVAFPNMAEDEIIRWDLHSKCDIEMIISKDWFMDAETFRERFCNAVERAFAVVPYVQFSSEKYELAQTLVDNRKNREIRKRWRERNEAKRVKCEKKHPKYTLQDWDQILKRSPVIAVEGWYYSLLVFIRSEADLLNQMKDLLEQRKKGTKIILLCCVVELQVKKQICELIKEKMRNDINAGSDLKKLSVDNLDWTTFLFELHCIAEINDDMSADFTIIDGDIEFEKKETEDSSDCVEIKNTYVSGVLKYYDANSSFNLQQYLVEHFDINSNLVIKAGAGTGKTFSMLGRVAFLIHKNVLEEYIQCGEITNHLSDIFYMMTFTNNSTNEMRNRIAAHLQKYYIVTHKSVYMELVKEISNITIKTIDAMAKMLISKYAFLVGMTSEMAVTSGKFQLEQIIRKNVQNSYDKNAIYEKYINSQGLRSYELENVVKKLLKFLSERGISFSDKKYFLASEDNKYGSEYKNFLDEVARKCVREYREFCNEKNQIEMSNIVLILGEIKVQIADFEKDRKTSGNKYLFVDEFQDTDNHQIELINYFSDIFSLKLYVVGDIKQGIYGFRGANDSAFRTLIKNGKEYGKKFVTIELNKNYRTNAQLLQMFDEKFKAWPEKYFKYSLKDVLVPQKNFGVDANSSDYYRKEVISDQSKLSNKIDEIITYAKSRIMKFPFEEQDEEVIAILTRTRKQIDEIKRMDKCKKWGIEFDSSSDFYRQDAVIDFYKLVCALLEPENVQKVYSLIETPYVMCEVDKSEFMEIQGMEKRITNLWDLDIKVKKSGMTFEFKKYYDEKSTNSALKLLQTLVAENKPWLRYVPEKNKNSNSLAMQNKFQNEENREFYRKCLDQLFQLLIEKNGTEYITMNQIKDRLDIEITRWQDMELFSDLSKKRMLGYLDRFLSMGIKKMEIISDKGESSIEVSIDYLLGNESTSCNNSIDSDELLNKKISIVNIKPIEKKVVVKLKSNIRVICTTVHKSKGLEYRAVILPYTTTNIGQISGTEIFFDDTMKNRQIEYCFKRKTDGYISEYYKSKGFDQKMNEQTLAQSSEELRILYVALTRAMGEFYYIEDQEKRNNLENGWVQGDFWAKYL